MLYGHGINDKTGYETWQLVAENASEEMTIEDLRMAMKDSTRHIEILIKENMAGSTEVHIRAVDNPLEADDNDGEE